MAIVLIEETRGALDIYTTGAQRALEMCRSVTDAERDLIARGREALGMFRATGRVQEEVVSIQARLGEAARRAGILIGKMLPPIFRVLWWDFARAVEENEERLEYLGRRIGRTGWRLSWMAYRLLMMGRIVTRWFTRPLREALQRLVAWERQLDLTSTALALLAATGRLTAEEEQRLIDLMGEIVEVGPQVAGEWAKLQASFMRMAVEVGPQVANALSTISKFLDEEITPILEEHGGVIEDLVVALEQDWLPILSVIAEEAIPPFLEGLREGVPILTGFFDALLPFITPLAQLAGLLAPLAPLLTTVGIAFYFLTPIMQGIAFILGGLPAVIRAVSAAFTLLAAHPAIAAVALVGLIATFIHLMQTNEEFRQTVIAIWEDILNFFGYTLEDWNNFVDALISAWETFVGALMEGYRALSQGWRGFVETITKGAQTIRAAIETLRRPFQQLSDWVSGAAEWLFGSPETIFADAARDIAKLRRELGRVTGLELGVAPAVRAGAVAATQHISIYPSITIGTVTGVADLDMITDAVSEGISEALRRRR